MTFTIKQGELFWIGDNPVSTWTKFLDGNGTTPQPILPARFQPPAVRNSDPATSHAAAADVAPRASKGRLLAMRLLLEFGPMTDFELAARSGLQQTSIGKRRGELYKAGLIVKYPTYPWYRRAPSGSWATVWMPTDAGRRWYEENRR